MGPLVRAAGMQGYPVLMRSLGHDPAPLLARCGLSEALLADEDRRVPLQQAYELIRISVDATGLQDFSLRAAAGAGHRRGRAARAGDAERRHTARIDRPPHPLPVRESPALRMTLQVPGLLLPDTADLCYEPAATGGLHHVPQVVDHGPGLAHVSLRSLLGPRYALRAARGVAAAPAGRDAARLRAVLRRAPVHGARPVAALHYAQAMLSEPVRATRPALLRIAGGACAGSPGLIGDLRSRATLRTVDSQERTPASD